MVDQERRDFLKNAGVGLIWLLGSPLISACSAAAQVAAPAAHLGKKALWEFVADFAVQIGSGVVAESVNRWIAGRSTNEQQHLDEVNAFMADHGFTDLSHTTVFSNRGDVYFYHVGHELGLNGCVPFFTPGTGTVLVEGPFLVGTALAAGDWDNARGVTPAEGLIPREAYQDGGMQFEASMEKPFYYRTDAGWLAINYEANPEEKRGYVGVVAERDNGGKLFGRDYELAWA
ncbi:MAG: hypothetical protein MN733_29860 [Nitrososphaera sp.]|nr:hypothetical protein [Nitrososphaera sp.]